MSQCFSHLSLFLFSLIESSSGWMVLVLDEDGTRVISSVLTMYDIMEERVTLVEQLFKNRQPFREMEVIYLVAPTVESVTRISQDFASESKAKYGGVHIYFLDVVSFVLVCISQSLSGQR